MESYLLALGILVGALAILAVVFIGAPLGEMLYSYIYRVLAVLAAMVAIGAILKMRSVYDHSMFDWRLKRRQRGADLLDEIEFE